MTDITHRGLLGDITIRVWPARVIDDKVSREAAEQQKAEEGSITASKWLVPYADVKPIFNAAAAARRALDGVTLPWGRGVRIFATSELFNVQQVVEKSAANFNKPVEKFLLRAPALFESLACQARLGDAYNPDDFPEVSSLRRRYGIRFNILPVPDVGDFRVAISAELEASFKEDVEEKMRGADGALVERLLKCLNKFVEKMADDGSIFRDSTVENLRTAARVGRGLTGDGRLVQICDELTLLPVGESLRGDNAVRQSEAQHARDKIREIEEAMRGATS